MCIHYSFDYVMHHAAYSMYILLILQVLMKFIKCAKKKCFSGDGCEQGWVGLEDCLSIEIILICLKQLKILTLSCQMHLISLKIDSRRQKPLKLSKKILFLRIYTSPLHQFHIHSTRSITLNFPKEIIIIRKCNYNFDIHT